MPTIDELLGPAPIARRESIAELLGPEQTPVSYFQSSDSLVNQPERPDTPADFLDERTAVKTPLGFRSTQPTKREELEAERDTVVDTASLDKLTAQAAVGGRYGSVGGLKKTLAGVLRAVNAPPILTWLWSKSADQDAEDAAKFGEMIGGGKAGQTAQEFGSTAIQSLPALAAAPAGLLGIAVTAGAQTFGSVTEDAFQSYSAKGDPDALNKSRLAGAMAGVVTAGLTRWMPGGTERFAAALGRGELSQLAAQGVIKTILKEAAKEFPEEALDQVSQGIIAKFSYRPETTWENIADDSLKAGLMGSALAGFTGTAILPAVRAASRLRGGSSLRNSIAVPTEPVPEGTAGSPVEGGRMFGAPPAVEVQTVAPPQVQTAPIINPEPAAVTQTVGEEPTRIASAQAIPTTAQESRTTAETMTPEAILAELESVNTQIVQFQKPATDATTEAKLAYVDAKGKLSNRANFLREALKIQEEANAPKTPTATQAAPETVTARPTGGESIGRSAVGASEAVAPGIQKYQLKGTGPQTHTLVERLPASEVEVANGEQPVLVRNDKTGKQFQTTENQLVAVQTGTGGKRAKVDLDQELRNRKLEPSVFPDAKSKRAAITRHDALTKQNYRGMAESIASNLEGIKSGRRPGDLQLFGVIPAVWDAAVSIAQGIIRAGGTVADAIKAALDHIRTNNNAPFDEAGAAAFIDRAVQPETEYVEPPTDEAEAPNDAGMTVNIAGREYPVIDKVRLTPEQRAAGDARAQEQFRSLEIPGVPDATVDKRAGSIDNNTVWKVVADGQTHDVKAEALRAHLVEQIQKQNTKEGDAAYVSSLINAINMNFDLGNWRGVISQPVLESLLNVSVGESSRRGTMLRQLRGISEDIRAIAQNAALRLKWVYAEAFDPDGVGRDAMRKINELFRAHFTRQIINRVVSENPSMVEFYNNLTLKADAARPQLAEIIQQVFSLPVSKQSELADRFVAQLARGFTMSDVERAKAAEWFNNAFRQEMQFARSEALKSVLASMTKQPGSTRKPTTLAAKIEKIVNDGGLDDAELFRQFAKDNRWNIPTDKEIEQMREWVNREQQLRSPSPEEVAKLGAEAARSAVEAATIDTRKELLRKMNTQWSQWTQPLVTNWRDLGNAEKVRNTNMAFNEWVAANLLLKIGFGTRQVVDVMTQMGLNTPTRALAYAWENYRINPDDSNLQHSIAEAFSDAYRTRLKVLGYALNSFKQTVKGKGEQRQVEQLISSIGIFDRALLNAQKMRAEGKRGAANLLEVIAIGMRMGRQFAAAMDVVHGIPAEAQEIAHQVRNALKEKGLSGAALDVQFDSIMGILTAHRAEAISMAREMLELRGADTSSGAVERAAWHILREKIYDAAQQSKLPADEWKTQNALYRDLIGWNLTETGGLKAPGGPGGLIALGGKAAKAMLSKVPLVGGVLSVPFTFTNAMGISMNRKLAWSPLGFFPGIFKGSPHWEGEANIRQRKVEAAIGTGLNAMVFSLIIAGVWKALPAFWPKDEKERDRWVRNGWSPGMVIVPWGNDREVHLSTRTGPLAFFAPSIAAAAAYTSKVEDRAKKQAAINLRAKKLGLAPEQLEWLGAADWMGIMFGAGYSALSGGRTASGAIGAYTDFGEFNVKKAAASVATAITPGFPALNEFGRLAGANINPKLASFWDLMVPMPTSNAQRVNMLGDPMKDENDYRRVFTILSGGNFPFPTTTTPAETQAYAALFGSEYRPPAINPSRGYQVGNKLRPMTADELQRYTVARGVEFKQALSALSSNPTDEAVKAAFVSANQRALSSVGVTTPKPSKLLGRTPTRYRSRLRGGRTRRIRGFGRSRLRSRIGSRRRRLGTLR